jgi:hypothetical protein
MNERAIELYKQALEFAYTTIGKEHADTAFFQGVVAGKLSELIVRKCMALAEQVGQEYCDTTCDSHDRETQTSLYTGQVAADTVKQRIQDHFEVTQ